MHDDGGDVEDDDVGAGNGDGDGDIDGSCSWWWSITMNMKKMMMNGINYISIITCEDLDSFDR